MEPVPGALVGGKFRIERPLARGGMGSVWVARHEQLGSTVAIKFLDASFAASPAHRARFEREARSSANLKSPHVVHVSDYGFEGDSPYLVMELLEGEDLGQRLHRERRMNLRDTAKVLVQVGKALRKAHEAGIAHRDLKPANLFIARVDDEEVVKILDFGIAKDQHTAAGDATKTGEVIGSPHYMSPEQVRAEKDLDYRTDLWSLGIILYRMLVGVLPFPGDQLGPVLAKILTEPLPVATQQAPDLPPSLDAFFMRALARDKNQRFQSIAEMVDAFQAAAGGKEAFPSISMSLGTGGQPVGAGGTALWIPQGQPGALTGTGPQTGPHTGPQTGPHTGPQTGAYGGAVPAGTHGGLAGTGPSPVLAPPPKRPMGVVFAIVGVVVTLMLFGVVIIGLLLTRTPNVSPSALASDPSTPSIPAPIATVVPAMTASATSTAADAPTESPTAAAPTTTASSSAVKPGVKPKPTGTVKPKEKWF